MDPLAGKTEIFNSQRMRENLSHIPGEVWGIESERIMFRTSIVDAASKGCGPKVVVPVLAVTSGKGLGWTRFALRC